MEEILHQFGFNAGLFVAQIVNFLILAFLFKKFLYTPLLKTIKERRKTIEQGLTDAEQAKAALEKAEEERTRITGEATKEAQAIIADTKKQAESLKNEILAEARADAEKIIAQAKEQSALEMEKMRKEAGKMSLSLSKTILDSVVKQIFSASEKDVVMKKGIKEIEKHG